MIDHWNLWNYMDETFELHFKSKFSKFAILPLLSASGPCVYWNPLCQRNGSDCRDYGNAFDNTLYEVKLTHLHLSLVSVLCTQCFRYFQKTGSSSPDFWVVKSTPMWFCRFAVLPKIFVLTIGSCKIDLDSMYGSIYGAPECSDVYKIELFYVKVLHIVMTIQYHG